MENLAWGLRLSSARIAPCDASGNVASGLERNANLGHEDDIVAHLSDKDVGGLIQHRERPVMARNVGSDWKKRLQASATVVVPMV
jgi:hypothetical protein